MDQALEESLKNIHDPEIEKRLAAVKRLAEEVSTRYLPQLVHCLSDSEWRIRKTAVEGLTRLGGDPNLIEQLLSVFSSEGFISKKNGAAETLIAIGRPSLNRIFYHLLRSDKDVKKFLIEILGEIGHREATDELLPLLSDPDHNVKLACIEALGKIGDSKAVESLISILEDQNVLSRFAVVKALDRIGDPRASDSILNMVKVFGTDRSVLEALGTIGKVNAVSTLVEAMGQGSDRARRTAILSLVRLFDRMHEDGRETIIRQVRDHYDETSRPLLSEMLGTEDEPLRRAALRIIKWAKDKNKCKELLPLLDSSLRNETIETIIGFGRSIVPVLMRGLPYGNEAIRGAIARILGEMGDQEGVTPLMQLLGDTNGHVREAAAYALAKINDPASAKAILNLLADQYPSVQESAVEALSYFKNPDLVTRLMDYTESPLVSMRRHSVKILGKMKVVEAIQKILICVKDEDPGLRRVAIEALSEFESPEAESMLLVALGDEDQEVRLAALSTIVNRPGFNMIKHVEPLLHDENIWVRAAAVRALAKQKGSLSNSLNLGMLKDKVGVVQIAAIEGLAANKSVEFCSTIFEMTKNPDLEVVKAALYAVGRLDGYPFTLRIQGFLDHENWGVRLAAAHALGQLKDSSSKTKLEQMKAHDPDRLVRDSVQSALAQMSRR